MVVYMKKIVCLLVAIIFFSCDHQYDNFKITGINMHAVTFNDSIRSKKRYFLIDFTTVLCHPKSTLFGGGVEPGLKGIDENIKSIDIYTRNGKTISSIYLASTEIKGYSFLYFSKESTHNLLCFSALEVAAE